MRDMARARRKSMRVGGGGRFAKLKRSLARRGVRNPGGLAATIGRRKYGRATFKAMSAAGRRRARRR